MTKREVLVSRKNVVEDRIAICPQYGCTHLERVKPLKFGVLGFRKYPKCSKHKTFLIFVDEFIGGFFVAVKACLFDISSLPPLNLKYLIKTRAPEELMAFINGWMYCNPIGSGAQIVSQYMEGLSRAYMKLLSRKQRKALKNENNSRKRYEMLRLGLKKIVDDYTTFLQELREKSEILYGPKNICPLSDNVQKILKTWLKQHLNTIKGAINIKRNEFDVQDDSLQLLKEEYDKILHAGTCALLFGKKPSIVLKSISAFELFSAYHEFLNAGLCKELKGEDLNPILENSQDFLNINREDPLNIQNDEEIINLKNINITNFRQEVIYLLKTLFTFINGSQRQKNIIRSKSIEILDDFISRANSGEFYIPKDANLKVIASAIIYTVIVSHKNTPKISVIQLAKVMNIKNWILITNYYRKYFDRLYPRKEFRFASYKGFLEIRNIISLYFFEILRNNEIEISDLVSNFLLNVQQKIKLPIDLTYKHNEILYEMATQYEDTFFKYFNDLGELIKHLIISSNIHKRIGAKLMITPISDFLNEKGFNLFQTRLSYISSVTDIFDFLKTKYPKIFPIRFRNFSKNRFTQEEYKKIVGNKLKIYALRNIYNGFYLKYNCRCPQCVEEGFEINTSISRLSAIDVHHQGDLHENYYNAIALYNLFSKDRSNPYFLEDLILKMESEKVIVVCKNHHTGFSFKYLKYFQYLISWDNIYCCK